MFLLAHSGITLAAARFVEKMNKGAVRGVVDYRFILIGSVLPDLIDKPLGGLLLRETLGNGRTYSHTLAFLILLFAAGLLFKGKWRNVFLTLAGASMMHHILDGMWRSPDTFLWPLYGWRFPRGVPENWIDQWIQNFLNNPFVFVPEITGGVFLLFFLAAVSRTGIKSFLLTGRL
ncbi:MAG: metal-dependent hydrolase [Clostridiales bacterium]|nr:metal-dependent hydrolase [Clostridiales bacterium]MCF8022814.1 metal-dependent hydrolase [Clostridiales bacterium]